MISKTPKPPYYAVIFTSVASEEAKGYSEMAEKMIKLAENQTGFLGIESAREAIGITVSYWESIEAIRKWKQNTEHLFAQKLGKDKWYHSYKTRICLVERDYEFDR